MQKLKEFPRFSIFFRKFFKFFARIPTISFFLLIIFCIDFFSCSLKYSEDQDYSNITPELKFTNAIFSRYENSQITTQLMADELEQYKGDGASYAKNAKFETWNKDGKMTTKGACSLLGMNSQDEIYTLFGGILLENFDQNFKINAENLKWNGKNEQLTSGQDDEVFINRDDIEMYGAGFSASGVSQSFMFSSGVRGTITTNDENSQEENSNEE